MRRIRNPHNPTNYAVPVTLSNGQVVYEAPTGHRYTVRKI